MQPPDQKEPPLKGTVARQLRIEQECYQNRVNNALNDAPWRFLKKVPWRKMQTKTEHTDADESEQADAEQEGSEESRHATAEREASMESSSAELDRLCERRKDGSYKQAKTEAHDAKQDEACGVSSPLEAGGLWSAAWDK